MQSKILNLYSVVHVMHFKLRKSNQKTSAKIVKLEALLSIKKKKKKTIFNFPML